MSDKIIIYDEDHMKTIFDKYVTASDCIDEIMNSLCGTSGAQQIVLDNYQGQAKDLVNDLFDKMKSHLTFLQSCCTSVGDYVASSLDTMKAIDITISNK